MRDTFVIMSSNPSPMLINMVNSLLGDKPAVWIQNEQKLPLLNNSNIVFACELNASGICETSIKVMSKLRSYKHPSLEGSKAVVLVHSEGELYTKSFSQWIILNANYEGCYFDGHPVVEATGSLNNYHAWQKSMEMSLEQICLTMCSRLGSRLFKSYNGECTEKVHRVLALHASERKTSNSLLLWNLIKENLNNCSINELHVENGSVMDCTGCSFVTCNHYSKQSSCFYGGVMVKDIYPAIEAAEAVVWICPNYNDAVSANLTAVINRLTALYRKISFYDKAIFSVIVSGNSGGDSVAKQLIGSLVVNKGFCLPPMFGIYATANDPLSVLSIAGIQLEAKAFGSAMESFLLHKNTLCN